MTIEEYLFHFSYSTNSFSGVSQS